MPHAEHARELVSEGLPEGACISLPIPARWEGELVTAFFTFSISSVGHTPYPARDCRFVLDDGSVAVDGMVYDLSSVAFDTSGDAAVEHWKVAYDLAYRFFDDALGELANGENGPACGIYAEAVKAATPVSQMPYYGLLCPVLFGK